jgi:HEPN domain-containing protein
MKTPADLVRGWLSKGDSDLAEAARCAASIGPYDTGCFHCQQAVEKYIKAALTNRGEIPHRTHDLGILIAKLATVEPSLRLARPDVTALTDYAVQLRYEADFWPPQTELANALTVARQVRTEILAIIPPNMHPAPIPHP